MERREIEMEDERLELRSETRRLAKILVNRVEQGVQDQSLDNGQVRLLVVQAIRCLRLWIEVLGRNSAVEVEECR